MHWLSLLYLLLRLLHVSAFICHIQGASCVLMNYVNRRSGYVVVMYCKFWWPVCNGCCSFVCYVVQLSAYSAGYGLLVYEVSRSHATTRHSRYGPSGRVISSSQRPLPDNTQQTNMNNKYTRVFKYFIIIYVFIYFLTFLTTLWAKGSRWEVIKKN
jgi:hypothetical protein